MLSSSASRRELPVSSSSTTRVCARRLASTHSCWKRSERVKSAIRSLITDCAPRSIAGREHVRALGQDLAGERREVDARVDRVLELLRDGVLDRGLGGDRRDGADVAVRVEQRDAQPERDEREHGEPAAEDQQQPDSELRQRTRRRCASRAGVLARRRSSSSCSATSVTGRAYGRRVTRGHPIDDPRSPALADRLVMSAEPIQSRAGLGDVRRRPVLHPRLLQPHRRDRGTLADDYFRIDELLFGDLALWGVIYLVVGALQLSRRG